MFTGLAGKSYDKFYTYLENLQRTNPERKVRYSDTVFIEPSTSLELFENIRHRIVNLTDLPYGMIKAGEHLQVVRYRPSGHYHSHLDSENSRDSKECCQYRDWKSGCKLCRYMTVLYFLNDVEEGGETAFPIADNVTVDSKILFGKDRHVLDLGRHCHDANVYYKPKKRSALIWYNHKVDPTTGWLGETDIRSLHGGCNVIKGSKWIANNWIDASPNYFDDIDLYVKSLFAKSPN
ncbi:transmembrane prolyl 4-hydroxylase-like isoform X3 [Dendronephthya gigantea]|nr:transmembrane prolyl 4-hydroxylase-like isoform X3 [Dendronephthya gigantea]